MSMRLLVGLLALLGCSGPPRQPESAVVPVDPEPIAVTQWTETTELFMEYPPLQAGEGSRFAIHLTNLKSFQPLSEGRVAVHLDYSNGLVETFSVDGPSQPGIFGINVTPPLPGEPTMTVRVQSSALNDFHVLGPVSVHGGSEGPEDLHLAPPANPADGVITFLKEQQWALDFGTQLVGLRSMQESMLFPATIEPRSGGRIVVTAPVSGRLLPTVQLPTLGSKVSQEEELGAIVPMWASPNDRSSLQLSLEEAKVAVESARRDRERVERLLAVGAIPARRLHEAKALEAIEMARENAAEKRMAYYEATRRDDPHIESQSAFSIRSHLAGVVSSLLVTDGAHVEEGDTVLEVTATDFVHVSGAVPESQATILRKMLSAEVQLPGSEVFVPVESLVSTARVVDPGSRTLKATYLVDNRRWQLAIGHSTFLRLFTASSVEAPIVPLSALVEDGGRTLLYVQTGGESFNGRQVTPGNQQGGEVQITQGLRPGERVVTRGAYLLRLASMTSQVPAHGHVH